MNYMDHQFIYACPIHLMFLYVTISYYVGDVTRLEALD